MILTALGWLAGLICAAAAAWRAFQMARVRKHPHTGKLLWGDALGLHAWFALLLWTAAAVAAFTIAGVFTPLAGGRFAGIAFVVILAGGKAWTRDGRHTLRTHVRYGVSEPAADAGRLWRWFRGLLGGAPEPEPSSPEAAVAEAAVAEAVATRGIPPVMADPALGVAPEPAELVSGHAQAPEPYAALAAFIAGFEPEDDMALRMFMESLAAGSVMVADAYHQFADTCLSTVGLDPAFVAGILEAGDSAAGHGTLLAQVIKRLSVIYGAVQEWVAAHGPLPHKARDFLTGGM